MRHNTLAYSLWLCLAALAPAATNEVAIQPTAIHRSGTLTAGPRHGDIARLVSMVTERNHYSQRRFDGAVSSQFLDRYVESWDPQRLHFLASDVEEFEKYRNTLDKLTIQQGDTTPAREIFTRYRDRLRERYDHVMALLPKEPLIFKTDEEIQINRKDAPRPATLEEAKKMWHQRLRYELLQEKLNDQKPEEIRTIIQRRYDRLLRTFEELDSEDVLQAYLSALAHVYDPHSEYLGKPALDNFNISMSLSLFGIGAVLTSEDGYCKIRDLTPEGPAARSKKLKPGDRIVAVAQGTGEPVDVVDMKLNKVVELIRGKKNSEVRLTVIPSDAADSSIREVVSIIRDEIKLEDQEAKARIIELPDADGKTLRLGSIDLPSFYADMGAGRPARERKSTTRDVARLIAKLQEQNIDGLILDLRRNGGGSLEEAINLTGLFISKGPVVQVKDYDGEIDQKHDTDATVAYGGPLVVLTSRFSASASEILAGALQDYGRALVVGDSSTHGKGTVQSLVQLSPYLRQFPGTEPVNPGALKITISKFYRASGSSTQLKGVVPDIVLPSVNNVADVGEASLENPLPWDTVPSARYQRMDMVTPHLAGIAKLSGARVGSDRDFDYVREDITRYEEIKAEKFVSLNEEKRRMEKADAKARTDARVKEINARNLPKHVTYEFTVTQASQPGLPPPLKQDELAKKQPHGELRIETPAETSDEEADAATAKAAARDVHFEEAKRIMADYIRALAKGGTVAAVKN